MGEENSGHERRRRRSMRPSGLPALVERSLTSIGISFGGKTNACCVETLHLPTQTRLDPVHGWALLSYGCVKELFYQPPSSIPNNHLVGKQYLDNTKNEGQKLNSYGIINLNFQKEIKIKNAPTLVFRGVVGNLGSINYTNNGYTFKYVLKKEIITENFYYPQSKINFLFGLDVKI